MRLINTLFFGLLITLLSPSLGFSIHNHAHEHVDGTLHFHEHGPTHHAAGQHNCGSGSMHDHGHQHSEDEMIRFHGYSPDHSHQYSEDEMIHFHEHSHGPDHHAPEGQHNCS